MVENQGLSPEAAEKFIQKREDQVESKAVEAKSPESTPEQKPEKNGAEGERNPVQP